MRIIGIDPGLRLTGYAVLEAPVARPVALVEAGVIRLDGKAPIADRLVALDADLAALLAAHRPEEMVIEQVYSHYAHPRTAVLMAHARGVVVLAARKRDLVVRDVPATEVKKSLTGYGHASKDQVQRSVQAQLGLPEPPSPPDVADAIAIALTRARRRLPGDSLAPVSR